MTTVHTHGETGSDGYGQKNNGKRGTYSGEGILTHKFSHHHGIYHIIELLKKFPMTMGRAKKKSSLRGFPSVRLFTI